MYDKLIEEKDLKILKHDLEDVMSSLDFKHYHPLDKKFQTAISLAALIALADNKFFDDYKRHEPEEHEECSEEVNDRIEEELKDSRFYLSKFKETRDKRFLLLAKDELRHAETIAAINNTACCNDAINKQKVAVDSAR